MMKWGFGFISMGCCMIMLGPANEGYYVSLVVSGLFLSCIGGLMVWKGMKK